MTRCPRGVRFAVAAALAFACLCAAPLSANPFMGQPAAGAGPDGAATGVGSGAQISPVRAGAVNPELAKKQGSLRDEIANHFRAWKENPSASLLWGMLGVAFFYGILHAMGPGHRKTVVFSLYLAREAPAWEPAGMGLALSLLHGGAALIVLLLLRGVTGALSGKADTIAIYMEGGAYGLLIVVALFLVIGAVRDLARGHPRHGGAASLGTILLTGIYPCPGAILVLILSLTLGITGVGALSVLAMSLGMSLPIVAAGYLAWFGRTGLFHALKKNEARLGRVASAFELAGYAVLLAFACYMAAPFLASVARGLFA